MNEIAVLPRAKPGEDMMTVGEAKLKREKGFRDRMCRVYYPSIGVWQKWSLAYMCPTNCIESDSSMTVFQALTTSLNETILFVTNPNYNPETDQPPPHRRCLFGSAIPEPIRLLLESAPNNITVREFVRSSTGIALPKECDTFEKIKEWVELNHPSDQLIRQQATKPLVVKVNAAVQRDGEGEYVQSGTCRGSATLSPETLESYLPSFLNKGRTLQQIEEIMFDAVEAYIQRNTLFGGVALTNIRKTTTTVDDGGYDHNAISKWVKNFLRAKVPSDRWAELGL